MRLSNLVRGRRVRRSEWASDEWVKITLVSKDYVCGLTPAGKEIVFPLDKQDENWLLFYPTIPLKPLPSDYDEVT